MNESPFEIEFKKQLIVQLKELNKNLREMNTALKVLVTIGGSRIE